jgi:hypothetical protein
VSFFRIPSPTPPQGGAERAKKGRTRIFKICRCLSVVAIVEGTWYKCINWFDERRNRSMVLVNGKKVWSTKVTEKLNKRAGKSRPHRVDP